MAGLFDNMRVGYDWAGDQGWINPKKVAKKAYLAPGVGLAADYDPTQDTFRTEVNGTQESAMQRAMRWAQDMINSGKTTNYQNALNFAMANLSSDYQRGGMNGTLGWDPAAFRYNDVGEAYNDEIDYANPTKIFQGGASVINPTPNASGGSGGKTRTGPVAPPPVVPPPVVPPPVVPPPVVSPPTVGDPANSGGGPVYKWKDGTVHDTPEPAAAAADPNSQKNLTLSLDEKAALGYVMDRLGINMDRPGLYANKIMDAISGYVTPYMEMAADARDRANGAGVDYTTRDHAMDLLNELTGTLQGGGGFGRIAQMAREQAAAPDYQSGLTSMGAEDALNAMQTNLFLRMAGQNRMGQTVRSAAWERAFGGRDLPGAFGRASLNNQNLHPAEWLAASPWADLLNKF